MFFKALPGCIIFRGHSCGGSANGSRRGTPSDLNGWLVNFLRQLAEDVINFIIERCSTIRQTICRRFFISTSSFRRRLSSDLSLDVALVIVVKLVSNFCSFDIVVLSTLSIFDAAAFWTWSTDGWLGFCAAEESIIELSDDSVQKIEGTSNVVTKNNKRLVIL